MICLPNRIRVTAKLEGSFHSQAVSLAFIHSFEREETQMKLLLEDMMARKRLD